jgi:hypothetical protein
MTQRLLNPGGVADLFDITPQALKKVGIRSSDEHKQIGQYLLQIENEIKKAIIDRLLPTW